MTFRRNVPLAGAALLLIAFAAANVSMAQSPAPFSRAEILTHLRSQVTPYGEDWEQHQVDVYDLCDLVEQRGVSFTYGEGTPTGFDEEMHNAAGGTTGRSASGQSCNLVYLIENNRRNGGAAPDDAIELDLQAEATPEVVDLTPDATAPRMATYYVMAYGDINNPLRLGTFDLLPDERYRAYLNGGTPAGEGRYGYDHGEGLIHWLSGPYEEFESSAFSVIREGKTHRIELNRTTIGFNDAP